MVTNHTCVSSQEQVNVRNTKLHPKRIEYKLIKQHNYIVLNLNKQSF